MQTTKPILAKTIEPTDEGLRIVLADREVLVAWADCSAKLAAASAEARRQAELSPGGYGVHWPQIDEDLSIGGILRRTSGV